MARAEATRVTREHREPQVAAPARREGLRALLAAASVLLPLSVVEIFALAPREQWLEPGGWLVQAAGGGLVLLGLAAAIGVAAGLAKLLGRRLPGVDLGFGLGILIIANAHLKRPFGLPTGSLPRSLIALILAVVVFVALKAVSTRYRLSFAAAALALIAVLALPVGLTAIHFASVFAPVAPPPDAVVAAGGGLYLVLVGVAIAWGGRWRSRLLAATTVLGLAVLRFSVPNPYERHVIAEPPTVGAGPPVLLIVLDTLRADSLDLTAPGGSRTPHLARLASEADLYVEAIANASWSLPGHATLFTGLPVSQHRTDTTVEPGFTNHLPRVHLTAHEIFAAHGYQTACVTANPLVSMQTGLARGCQRYQAPGASWILRTHALRLYEVLPGEERPLALAELVVGLGLNNMNADAREIIDDGLREVIGDPHPLYLFLNFMDAHRPLPAAPGEPLATRAGMLRDWALAAVGRAQFSVTSRQHTATLRGRYSASVERLDRELGHLFDELRRRGWYDRMLIVVTADHGEALGDNPSGGWGHHGAFEPVVRIPLIIKRLGQHSGTVRRHPVQQTDVLPALMALAGLPPPKGLTSRVLDPAIDGTVFTEWHTRGGPTATPYRRIALYRGRYKFVVEGDEERELLFDLERSPGEDVDIRASNLGLAAELRAELDAALRSASPAPTQAPASDDPAVQEALRALGYIQ